MRNLLGTLLSSFTIVYFMNLKRVQKVKVGGKIESIFIAVKSNFSLY